MAKHRTIKRAYIRHYNDGGQTKAYIEWSDGVRTEGDYPPDTCPHCGGLVGGTFITSLLKRAESEGGEITRENW